MTFKNCFRKINGQAAVEYIAVFVVLAASILIVFQGFATEDRYDPVTGERTAVGTNLKLTFDRAVDSAISSINSR